MAAVEVVARYISRKTPFAPRQEATMVALVRAASIFAVS